MFTDNTAFSPLSGMMTETFQLQSNTWKLHFAHIRPGKSQLVVVMMQLHVAHSASRFQGRRSADPADTPT